jgi:membrane fusion protein (multidrug efflux system)
MNRDVKDKVKAPQSNSRATMEVKGIVASGQDFANVITVSGSVEANEQVQIRSEVNGMVKNLYFQEGTNVKEGQILLQIDDSELQARQFLIPLLNLVLLPNHMGKGLIME